MKLARLAFLFLLASILMSCGSSPKPQAIDGAWRANLQDANSSTAYTFTVVFSQSAAASLDILDFHFVPSALCFPSSTGQSATFSATGHSKGFETGPFTMNVSTAFGTMTENVLALNGTRNSDGTISGTWTLTGQTGCSGGGNYSMQLLPRM